MDVGEVYLVQFPTGAGRAQAGRRPAVVVQSARSSARLPTLLLAPLTTQREALRFPGTVLLEPDGGNRLTHVSVALVCQPPRVGCCTISGRGGGGADMAAKRFSIRASSHAKRPTPTTVKARMDQPAVSW